MFSSVRHILVRPFFLMSAAKFYTDFVDVKAAIKDDLVRMPGWEASIFSWHSLAFVLLAAMLAADVFFASELGIPDWIQQLAAKDLAAISR
jgi:hypothetical protein